MKRRDFLKISALGLIGCSVPGSVWSLGSGHENYDDYIRDSLFLHPGDSGDGAANDWEYLFNLNNYNRPLLDDVIMDDVLNIKDYLVKMSNFDKPFNGDIIVGEKDFVILGSTLKRLKGVQRIVGNGHYQKLSFDDALKVARNYSSVGRFSKEEVKFMETIFYREASLYGFAGEKSLEQITECIDDKILVKVPYTGNYMYKGVPLDMYKKIKKQIGDKATLTSGVRGIMKQFYLFLNKAYKNNGNLSLASRSLAPPGYSFHGKGDFDVGQAGFGASNFTQRFTNTEVFKRLCDLGYLKLRYPKENYLGVRFEPWHIKTNQA